MVRLGLFAIFVSLFATQCLQLVNGDAQLINRLCQSTPSPNFCRDCINSTPGSETKTQQELADVSLACVEKAAVVLTVDFFNCAGDGSRNFRLECSLCNQHFITARDDLKEARRRLGAFRFQQAADSVTQAIGQYKQCAQLIGIGILPPPLSSDLQKFDGYSQSAVAILRQTN